MEATFKNNNNISYLTPHQKDSKTRQNEVATMVNRSKSCEMSNRRASKETSSDVCFVTCNKSNTSSNSVNLDGKNANKSSKVSIGCTNTRRAPTGVGFLTAIRTSNDVYVRSGCRKGIHHSVKTTISPDCVSISNPGKILSGSSDLTSNESIEIEKLSSINNAKNENKTLNKLNEIEIVTRPPSPSPAITNSASCCMTETRQQPQNNLRVAWKGNDTENSEKEKYTDTKFLDDVIIEYDENNNDVISSGSSSIEDMETKDDHVNIEDVESESNDEDYDTDIEEEFPGLFKLEYF